MPHPEPERREHAPSLNDGRESFRIHGRSSTMSAVNEPELDLVEAAERRDRAAAKAKQLEENGDGAIANGPRTW